MKLKIDLNQKNNSILFFLALMCCINASAQTNTESRELNKKKIDQLIEKVETITSNQDYVDSILKVNKELTLRLQELESKAQKNSNSIRESELVAQSGQKEFIVIAVYNKEAQAQRFIELNELKGFEVVTSSSKNKFYVAARLQKNENLLISIKAIKNKYNRNAWYVAI